MTVIVISDSNGYDNHSIDFEKDDPALNNHVYDNVNYNGSPYRTASGPIKNPVYSSSLSFNEDDKKDCPIYENVNPSDIKVETTQKEDHNNVNTPNGKVDPIHEIGDIPNEKEPPKDIMDYDNVVGDCDIDIQF